MSSSALLLRPSQQRRLHLYHAYHDFSRANMTSPQIVRQIAQMQGISLPSVYRIITQIRRDLTLMGVERDIARDTNKISLCEKFKLPAAPYEAYLMRQSTIGQFLLAILQTPDWTIHDFAAAQQISLSTAMRHLKPLQRYLQPLNIKITLSPIGLRGNEAQLRFILTDLIWPFNLEQSPCFPELEKRCHQHALRFFSQDSIFLNVARRKLMTMIAIHTIRQQHGHQLADTMTLTTALDLAGMSPAFAKQLTTSEEVSALIVLQTLLSLPFNRDYEPQLLRFVGRHVRKNTLAWQFISYLHHRFKDIPNFVHDQHRQFILSANLLAVVVACQGLGHNIPDSSPVILAPDAVPSATLYDFLDALFNELPEAFKEFHALRLSLRPRLAKLLMVALPHHITTNVMIDERTPVALYEKLRQVLLQIPAVRLVTIQAVAQIIVTTNAEAVNPFTSKGHQYYYFAPNDPKIHVQFDLLTQFFMTDQIQRFKPS